MRPTTQIMALAATILAFPLVATAQSNNPTGNLGNNSSATATTPTANSPGSGMNTGDATAMPRAPSAAATNPAVPGATGHTVVPGTTSSLAGDHAGTASTKTGQAGGTGGGK